jgi:hypothetical protein
MQPTMIGGGMTVVVVLKVVPWYLTHMLWTQMAYQGYRPAQSESF